MIPGAQLPYRSRASDDAPLPWRMRPDLIIRRLVLEGRTYWHVKDPVASRYFQIGTEELFVLESLNGKCSAQELLRRFAQLHFPQVLGDRQLHTYLITLQEQGLIIGESENQTDQLLQRRAAQSKAGLWGTLLSPLAIRFRGVDPERMLLWLYPKCRWLFSFTALTAMAIAVVGAIILVIVQQDQLLARLPTALNFLRPANLVWLGVAATGAKLFHELGHALTCKHFGGECHEIGVMLLMFVPCPYCDVSDAWLFPSKWQRIAVSLAGMGIELVLASVSVFLWWFSEPGLLNSIFLNLSVVCSVNTVLFNGNPLLKYDGYHVLSDWLEIPNLRQRASDAVWSLIAKWLQPVPLFDRPAPEQPGAESQWPLLIVYATASFVYRVIMIVGIVWGLDHLLRPFGLEVIAHILAASCVVGLMWSIVRRAFRHLPDSQGNHSMTRRSLALAAAVLSAAVFLVPLPNWIHGPVIMEPREARQVFVEVAGRIPVRDGEHRPPRVGQSVTRGQVLVALENPALEKQVLLLESQLAAARSQVASLASIRIRQESVSGQLEAARETLRHLEQQREQLQGRRDLLKLTAPIDGIILPVEPRSDRKRPEDELATWSNSPLDESNRGATLEVGTPLCLIGDPGDLIASIYVAQSQIEFIATGASVDIGLNAYPSERLAGKVISVSSAPVNALPSVLASSGYLAIRDDNGTIRGTDVLFQVRVALEKQVAGVPIRSLGWARISSRSQTIYQRASRFVAGTFRGLGN